jgi:hypothetical protein
MSSPPFGCEMGLVPAKIVALHHSISPGIIESDGGYPIMRLDNPGLAP